MVVGHRVGGIVDIDGAVTDRGRGVVLRDNAPSSLVRFDGGLRSTTDQAPAFSAVHGGKVAVTDPPGEATNMLGSLRASALEMVDTTIHADGLTFQRISAGGLPFWRPVNGIVLDHTGSAGHLAVTGAHGTCTTAADCSGGAIVSTSGSGIYLRSTTAPSLTRMYVGNSGEDGIEGDSVDGLELVESVVADNGTTPRTSASGSTTCTGMPGWPT